MKNLCAISVLIILSLSFSACNSSKKENKTEVEDEEMKHFIGTSWSWEGPVTTMILTFVDDKNYSLENPLSETIKGRYKLETLDNGKKVITTDHGQYEIVDETLVQNYEHLVEDAVVVFKKMH